MPSKGRPGLFVLSCSVPSTEDSGRQKESRLKRGMESLSPQRRRRSSRPLSVKQGDYRVSPRKWHGRGPAACSREERSSTVGNRCKGNSCRLAHPGLSRKQGGWWERSHSVGDRASRVKVEKEKAKGSGKEGWTESTHCPVYVTMLISSAYIPLFCHHGVVN